jgi:dihydrodipicolinate synthase/N-acetylneuraminate lyase
MNDRHQALIYAGYMADLALGLVGGQGLNGTVYPVHPDKFSDLAKKLRHAAEQYNNHILEMYRRLND